MFKMFFGDVFATLTTVFVLGMLIFIIYARRNHKSIGKWGRLIGLFILAGTAISAFSAMRDGYAAENAVFAMDSIQSNICSLAGGAIFLTGFISIFLKQQKGRRACFNIISILFMCQVLVIEISRAIM